MEDDQKPALGDQELVKKILRGEIQYFSGLVEKYEAKIYKTCYRFVQNEEDALDLCQEVFIKIYNNLTGFEGASCLSTWIYKISVNTCLNFLRTRNRLVLDINSVDTALNRNNENLAACSEPENYVEMKEMLQLLDLNLKNTRKKSRDIFIYRIFHDMPFKKIGKKVGISSEAARMDYFRTKKLIRQSLKDYENGE